jgi:hypothetical protein
MTALLKKVNLDFGDGTPRVLFYDMKAAIQFEDEAKKNVKDFDIAAARDVCNMATVILKRTDPAITFDKVTELVNGQNWADVQKALAQVMGLKLLDGKGNEIPLGDEAKNPS